MAAYEAIVELGAHPELRDEASRMRQVWAARTGAFGPEDPWFEPRVRAFWDDALVTQGFAALALDKAGSGLGKVAEALAATIARAHRLLRRG